MAEPIEYRRIFQKVDTYDGWMANPLILGDGEQAFVRGGGVILNFRMGDGTKRFSELPNVIQYDQAAYVAAYGNTLPVPQSGVGYSLLTPGTYNGDLVVPENNLGKAEYIGNTWVVTNMEITSDVMVSNSAVDLSFEDEDGNSIMQNYDGEVRTKKFDSGKSVQTGDTLSYIDLDIVDESGYSVIQARGGHLKTKNFDSEVISERSKKSVKILFWGNSFAGDTSMYLPFLLEEMGVDNVEIGILYLGGATLEMAWQNKENPVYQLHTYETSSGVWYSRNGVSPVFGIQSKDWDMIILQQQSSASRTYSTYQPHLNNLVHFIASVSISTVSIRFLMIPASPVTGGFEAPGVTSNQFFEQQLACYDRIKNETGIEGFLYAGTAIQNGRQTALSDIAVNLANQDLLHLNEGLPCLLAAYGNAMSFKDILGLKKSVYGSKIRPTEEWLNSKNILERHGTSVGLDENYVLLAQKCAIAAYKFPFQITNVNY